MKVICVEGAHGSGKTELLRLFEAAGFSVLDEMFMNLPHHFDGLEAQSMVREAAWVTHWMERILRYKHEFPGETVVFADRSPFSAVVYANQGMRLKDCIQTQLDELVAYADIHVHTVLLEVEPDIHWERITQRLEREPERARYNESSLDWMMFVRRIYDDLKRDGTWDMLVQNDVPDGLPAVKQAILDHFHVDAL
jgi:thymidylate kinase